MSPNRRMDSLRPMNLCPSISHSCILQPVLTRSLLHLRSEAGDPIPRVLVQRRLAVNLFSPWPSLAGVAVLNNSASSSLASACRVSARRRNARRAEVPPTTRKVSEDHLSLLVECAESPEVMSDFGQPDIGENRGAADGRFQTPGRRRDCHVQLPVLSGRPGSPSKYLKSRAAYSVRASCLDPLGSSRAIEGGSAVPSSGPRLTTRCRLIGSRADLGIAAIWASSRSAAASSAPS